MLGQVGHPARQRSRGADVAKHHDGADDLPATIMDGRGGVLYGHFTAATPDENAVRREADGLVGANREGHGTLCDFSCGRIQNVEHCFERLSFGLRPRPAGQSFGNRVEIGHAARDIRADDGVPNRIERNLRTLLCFMERFGIGGPLDHAVDGLRQQVRIEAGLQKIILRTPLYRELCKRLILGRTENQNRDARDCTKHPFERLDTLAVGQMEVDEYGVDVEGCGLPRQPLDRCAAASDPLDDHAGVG